MHITWSAKRNCLMTSRGATTFLKSGGVQFLRSRVLLLFYRKKLDRSTQFGAVGYIITLYSSNSYVKSWGSVRILGGPDPPTFQWLRPWWQGGMFFCWRSSVFHFMFCSLVCMILRRQCCSYFWTFGRQQTHRDVYTSRSHNRDCEILLKEWLALAMLDYNGDNDIYSVDC